MPQAEDHHKRFPSWTQTHLLTGVGLKNIAQVRVDGKSSWALLDNSSIINAVNPEFVKAHSLDVGLLSNLVEGTLSVNGLDRIFSKSLGYIIMKVWVEGVQGYDDDKVALVIPNPTNFGSRVPVALGTLTINQIINVIKESYRDKLLVSLKWDKSIQLVGISSSRTLCGERGGCK